MLFGPLILKLTPFRYGVLNVDGVRNAMNEVPVARPNDKEKQDKTVAKAILEQLGLEKEKYRLGYTKVLSDNVCTVENSKEASKVA